MAQTKTRSSRAKKSQKKQTSAKSSGRKTARASQRTAAKANGSLLETFFIDALKDIYWAEKALTKALPRMSKAATSSELKKAFDQHLAVTKKQIGRLEKVFKQMGKKASGKKCEAMQGLIDEAETIVSETKDDTFTRDAALIIAAQKVEHYEIAAYGGLVQLARTMNKRGIANTLGTTLAEEKKTDEQLTRIAESSINAEAAAEKKKKRSPLKESFIEVFS